MKFTLTLNEEQYKILHFVFNLAISYCKKEIENADSEPMELTYKDFLKRTETLMNEIDKNITEQINTQ